MEFHPIANIFPLMQGKGFDELCEDIKANGLREPIWLYEGKILDGRNRHRACDRIGYAPEYRTYEGDDPYSFAGSLNIHRRHLTATQRAMLVADLVTVSRNGGPVRSGQLTTEQAGAIVGVKRCAVKDARQIKTRGIPELIAMAEDGRINGGQGRIISALPPELQQKTLDRMREIKGARANGKGPTAEQALREIAPGTPRVGGVYFCRDLGEMAIRLLDFYTAPQLDLLWDIIAKKQAEMIAARKEKAS